jgi:radical SAM superfamily enzyme YgiQ (UPF0313 family)
VTKGGTFYAPYFLAYAVGNLEKHGYEVKLVDSVASEWNEGRTLDTVRQFKPNLAILDTSTPSIYNDVGIASKIKEAGADHVSLVGTHPTKLPNQTLNLSKNIDSICRGEYDQTAVELAGTVESGKALQKVKGLTFRKLNKIYNNADRPLLKDLDSLPFVSEVYKKHLDIKKYFYASLRWPQVTILTARGCPYNCSFCNIPFKSSYRYRSPENVAEEFEYIQKELPEVKEVMIEDDTFPVIKERTEKICKLLTEKEIKLKWSCNARVNTDFATLSTMKKANCRLLCVGFETPRQNVLDNINKKTTKQLQLDFMRDTRKAGLLVNGCFILGLPGDTKETVQETIEFAKELNPDTVQFYPLMAYPGTEAYEWAKKCGYLSTEDYSKWIKENGMHTTVISRPGLTAEELVKLCDDARNQYYLRGKYIAAKAAQVISRPGELVRTLKSFRTFSSHLLRGGKK